MYRQRLGNLLLVMMSWDAAAVAAVAAVPVLADVHQLLYISGDCILLGPGCARTREGGTTGKRLG